MIAAMLTDVKLSFALYRLRVVWALFLDFLLALIGLSSWVLLWRSLQVAAILGSHREEQSSC